MSRGKKYKEQAGKIDRQTLYSPAEALRLVKETSFANFDETIEVHFNLGIDPRHADQQLRGTLALPNGSGKSVRIVVITSGDNIQKAQDAGADFVGGDDIVEKIQGGWFDFDLVIATPDMMAKVGRLGRVLGAKGLMPNPKSGTVTPNIEDAVKEFKGGRIEYRNDKTGLIHLIIGKKSFENNKLAENFELVYDTILKAKPAKAKGIYMRSVSLSSTMGPGVYVEPMKARWKEEG